MNPEAVVQYNAALKAGQKYYKDAISHGKYPYPLVLDDILPEAAVAGYQSLGVMEIPSSAIIGTKFAGRKEALAGNFMPLLDSGSEFAAKWIALCNAHLSDEGIRDPVTCFEYLGQFYIQEGNKRCSVLKSYDAPTIPAHVTRVIPHYSEDPEIRIYYEFMHFYSLSELYGVEFRHPGGYAKLQAALGFEPDQVWTEDERRSFTAVFTRFRKVLESLHAKDLNATAAEVLLVWLQIFSLADIRELSQAELAQRMEKLLPDVIAEDEGDRAIELNTEPKEKEKSVLGKLLTVVHPDHLNIAFLYACPPEESRWVRAHDDGRKIMEEHLGDLVTVRTYVRGKAEYTAASGDQTAQNTAQLAGYDALLEKTIADGAEVVFATDAAMVGACRKAAALHNNIKFLACAVSQPYTGVRMYNGRTYECKFVTGAIAGAMAGDAPIGYVANNPVYGTPASVNAFALGAKLTNPNAHVILDWACLPGDPVRRLIERGVRVVSNREIVSPSTVARSFELGTFRLQDDGSLLPLATPFWDWSQMYEKIVRSIFSGAWKVIAHSQAVNYWWGIASGVLDVHLSEQLPEGLYALGKILIQNIRSGLIPPFQMHITDQNGVLRNDGSHPLAPDEVLGMNWFCDNVEGSIPDVLSLRPERLETVRVLGLYREDLLPKTEGGQL